MIKIFKKASAEILLSIQSVRSELLITIILSEMLLMSTHNLYFHGEIKNNRIAWFPSYLELWLLVITLCTFTPCLDLLS